ncbi:MAG: inositol monophosphatase family protein [Bacteroidota bacterium]
MVDLKKVSEGVIKLSKEVGAFIRTEGAGFDKSKIQTKGFNDLVSYVDQEAEKRIVAGLLDILPGSGFIAEESAAENKVDKEYTWIIDPLDGTTNFIHGLPIFAVSIALMKDDKIILGVVYEINKDECFSAIEGERARCNDKEISVSGVKELSQGLLATGFPYYNFDKMPTYLDVINELMRKTHGLRRMGSAAVDLVYVACGRFEGFFEYNLNPWDVAAGAFIVQQAGGIVSDFKGGNNYVFGREMAAGCQIQPQMLEVIRKHWIM